MAIYTVFYGTQIVLETDEIQRVKDEISIDSDIHQSGYIYSNEPKNTWHSGWYRLIGGGKLDIDDVPKQLRTMALLLNL